MTRLLWCFLCVSPELSVLTETMVRQNSAECVPIDRPADSRWTCTSLIPGW